jgi:hypothetical protein
MFNYSEFWVQGVNFCRELPILSPAAASPSRGARLGPNVCGLLNLAGGKVRYRPMATKFRFTAK